MAAHLSMPPRDKCPGCHSAIYAGAREQGWCTDCMPPEIGVLRKLLGRRRFSAVLSDAVSAAVGAHKNPPEWDEEDLSREQWYAMYQAQCDATDKFAKLAGAKSDKALQERIAELEALAARLNHRLSVINDAVQLTEGAR